MLKEALSCVERKWVVGWECGMGGTRSFRVGRGDRGRVHQQYPVGFVARVLLTYVRRR